MYFVSLIRVFEIYSVLLSPWSTNNVRATPIYGRPPLYLERWLFKVVKLIHRVTSRKKSLPDFMKDRTLSFLIFKLLLFVWRREYEKRRTKESSVWDHGAGEKVDMTKRNLRYCVEHRKRSAGVRGGRGGTTNKGAWNGRLLTGSQRFDCHLPLCLQTASLLLPKKYNSWLGAWLPRKKKLHFQSPLQVVMDTWLSPDQTEGLCGTSRLFSCWVEECPAFLLCCWNGHMVVMSHLEPLNWGEYLRDSREQDWRRLGPSIIGQQTCPGLLMSRLLRQREVASILFKPPLFGSLLHYVNFCEAYFFYLLIYVLCCI